MSKMLHKEKIYKKKLRINHLLENKSVNLTSSEKKIIENPEGEDSNQKLQRQFLSKEDLAILKSRSFEKQDGQNENLICSKKQNEQMRVIYKQVNSLCNLISTPERQKKLIKGSSGRKSKGFLLNHGYKKSKKNSPNNNQEILIKYKLQKHLNRYSSLNESCENLTLRKAMTKEKSTTSRCDKSQGLSMSFELKKKKKHLKFALFNYDSEQFIHQDGQEKSLTKVTSILNLKPKNPIGLKRTTKLTAMNKYDLGYENIRLAYKLLSMKPTKPCDLKEQKKFYKKQEYFKEVRSRTIEMNEPVPLNLISQPISFPKINERIHTTIE